MLSIEQQVIAVIAAKFNVAGVRTITSQTDLRRDLAADSLAMVELLLLLEGEFQVDIPDEEAEEITTVRQIVDYLGLHVPPLMDQSRTRRQQHASR